MKLFWAYLKQHRRLIAFCLLALALFAASFKLYSLPLAAIAYPAALCLAGAAAFVKIDFSRVKRRHKAFLALNDLTAADEKLLPGAESIDDEDYRRLLSLLAESRAELKGSFDRSLADTLDYYTVWAHQIKTPISAMRLTLRDLDSPAARSLSAELGRTERYVDMAMAYLRLGSESGDYVIKRLPLDPIIRQAVKKLAGEFIGRRISLELAPTNAVVVSDEKWLCFVLEQLLSNALKYTREGSVKIYMTEPKTLCIRDTGIGIAPEDLPRIFDKGYTGENGRLDKRASGLGLYLCRRICRELGHGISAVSELGSGTELRLDLSSYELKPD